MSLQESKLLDSLTFCVLILKLAVHTLAVSYTAGVDLRFCLRIASRTADSLQQPCSAPWQHSRVPLCQQCRVWLCCWRRQGQGWPCVISASAFGTSQELEHPPAEPHPASPPNLKRFYCSNGSPALPAMGGQASSLSIRFNYP